MQVAASDSSSPVTLSPSFMPEGVDFSECVIMVQNMNSEATTAAVCNWNKTASNFVVSGVRSGTGAFDFGVVILTPPGYCTALPGRATGWSAPSQPALSDEEASMLPVYRCTITNGSLTNVKARGGTTFSIKETEEAEKWLLTPTSNPLGLTFSSCMPQLSGSSTANCPMAWDAKESAYVFAPNIGLTQTLAESSSADPSTTDAEACFQFILWS
jgi:hypothetical protein